MNNIELETFAERNEVLKQKIIFKVLSPDDVIKIKLKKNSKKKYGFILNLCKAGGCHWISVMIDRKCIYYYDPCGIKSYLLSEEINQFLTMQRTKIIYNGIQHQHEDSVLCGKFSLLSLFFQSCGVKMKDLSKLYVRRKLKRNDDIVNFLFKIIFEK